MTSYGDPHAGNEYDDDYYRPSYSSPPPPPVSSGRASVSSGGYRYDDEPADPGYGANQPGYGQQAPAANQPPAHYGQPQGSYNQGPNDYQPGYEAAGYQEQAPYNDPQGYNGASGGGYDKAGGYGSAAVGSAAVGSAAVGSAAVGSAAVGSAAAGSASVGTARVGAPSGRASVPSGRATVGGSSGRASVRPGGPAGPDGPDGPDGTGKGGRSGKGGKSPKAKSRQRRRNILLASVAVFILLAGGGLIAGTYFYDTVLPPEALKLKSSTEVYATDGTSQIAKLGSENRVMVDMATLDEKVRKALIAGEDKNFFEHDGIDLWGIGRAAWNNLTGGETQGASTITQQYARRAANDMALSYGRKLREAVMARKLEQDNDKETILGYYVNTVWFGRGSDGVGAAARAYFGKDADKLTIPEAAVLGAVLKQPEPVDGGHQGFDPKYNPDAAKERWAYVLNNMVEKQWITQAERDEMKYPENLIEYTPGQNAGETGIKGVGTGNVINYVGKEMRSPEMVKALQDAGIQDWRSSGLRITTTIDLRAQIALEAQVRADVPGSQLAGQPANLQAAAVAIEPQTGRVLAYFGGMDGTGIDYAGRNYEGTDFVSGGHPPASSFKIYTLAAAIQAGISIESKWDPTPFKYGANEIVNAGRDNDATCDTYCSLERMTVLSYNVPFFHIAQQITVSKVLEMANKAGVTTMWDTINGKAHDLSKIEKDDNVVRKTFDYQAAFGQYGITVLDHASGTATFAASGTYHKPHFVRTVERKVTKDGKAAWEAIPFTSENLKGEPRITSDVANEVTSVLKKIVGSHSIGREAAAKTGTWQSELEKGKNSNAWFIGYTKEIATAVWIGDKEKSSAAIKDKGGSNIGGSGMPGEIWERFMKAAHDSLGIKKTTLSNGSGGAIGDVNKGDGKSPTPSTPADQFPGFPNQTQQPGNGNSPKPSTSFRPRG